MINKFSLAYGNGFQEVEILEKNLLTTIVPNNIKCEIQSVEDIQKSIRNPIGGLQLKEIVDNKQNIVIIISDITRPTPSKVILEALINELNSYGIKDEYISIVSALGSHRKHTKDEIIKLIGEDLYARITFIDHDIDDCILVGHTSSGTPVEIFQKVYYSDCLIGTGNVEFHYMAGYSAGYKALMPGVCSELTIQENHKMMLHEDSKTGKLDGNPLREDLEEVYKFKRIDFIVNVVLDGNKEIISTVSGDPVLAHREGVKIVDSLNKVKIDELADIVVASCGGFPKDINLYQGQKGLENASYAVKEGGRIILLAECREGLGQKTFKQWMEEATTINDNIERIKKKFYLGGHKAVAISLVLQKAPTYLMSEFSKEETESYFFKYAISAQEALNESLEELGENSTVIVMPYANSTMPVLK